MKPERNKLQTGIIMSEIKKDNNRNLYYSESETLRAWALKEILKAYTYIQGGIKSKRSIAASKIKLF